MGLYVKGMDMPKNCAECPVSMEVCKRGYKYLLEHMDLYEKRADDCPLIEVKAPHGRLGDLDALRARMYHEAFDTDSEMQRWDSGCWIRYKMFERNEETAPTIIPEEE